MFFSQSKQDYIEKNIENIFSKFRQHRVKTVTYSKPRKYSSNQGHID